MRNSKFWGALVIAFLTASNAGWSQEKQSVDEVGRELANPLGTLWNLNNNIEAIQFFDGDINNGSAELGSTTLLQPVMPIPLAGEGDAAWRMITRPIIPLVFSTPVPRGNNEFDHKSGIGDIQIPLLFSFPKTIVGENWIFGPGPLFEFPTATTDALGVDQYSMGGAIVVGYQTRNWTAILFPNYLWKVGESGQDSDTPDTSKGSLLYQFVYNLSDGWQFGTNPTITYNDQADSGNKWTVPVGGFISRTVQFGSTPVNFRLGFEYNVVSPDDFGEVASIRLQITPVVPGLIQKPIFGR